MCDYVLVGQCAKCNIGEGKGSPLGLDLTIFKVFGRKRAPDGH